MRAWASAIRRAVKTRLQGDVDATRRLQATIDKQALKSASIATVEKLPDSCLPPKNVLKQLGYETID